MKKLSILVVIFLVMVSVNSFAHHPAADIIDPEIYEQIDEMLSQTPHVTIIDDMMTTTRLTEAADGEIVEIRVLADSMAAAESLINKGIVSFCSMLSGTTTITIEYIKDAVEVESVLQSSSSSEDNTEKGLWWNTAVILTITQTKFK